MFLNQTTRSNILGRLKPIIVGVFILLCGISISADQSWVNAMFFPSDSDHHLLPEIDDVYGVAFRDINQDGFADLYLVRFRDINRLFIYKKSQHRFKDKTISTGLGGNLYPSGIKNLELGSSIIDYNNDGVFEAMITGWGTTTKLFHQARRMIFENQTADIGIDNQLSGNASVWADVNLDGRLDVFITNEHGRNFLYVQNRNGTFKDVTADFNLRSEKTSQGAGFSDVNLDGYPDLYVCNWLAPDEFFLNQSGLTFEPLRLDISHLTETLNSNGVSFGDIDNDGDPDLLVTDRNGQNRLYRNDFTDPAFFHFTDITESSNCVNPLPAYSGLIADLDNNGWQDIIFTNIGKNIIYLNSGSGVFKSYPISNPANAHYSTGAAVADFDKDGDLDLFISNKDTASVLFKNPSNGSRSFIRVSPEGVISNRDGIGTKVWLYLTTDEKLSSSPFVGYREISGGSGYLSIGETIAHFGVDPNKHYSLTVQFPSGKTKKYDDVSPGQTIIVSEYDGISAFFIRLNQTAVYLVTQFSFWLSFSLVALLIASIGLSIAVFLSRYQWSHRQAGLFLSVVLIVLYLVYAVFRGESAPTVLGAQLITILCGLIITAGVMEYVLSQKKKRRAYRAALYNFSEQLIFLRENDTLFEQLTQMIYKTMQPEFCAVYIVQNQSLLIKHSAGISTDLDSSFELSSEHIHILTSGKNIPLEHFSDQFQTFYRSGCNLLVPVIRDEKLLALIAIGSPTHVNGYDQEDQKTFSLLANQTALAVENNYFIEKTKELTRQIIEAETKEKYISVLEKQNAELESLYAELKNTHLQLVQSEKMSSLGQLVAGVAHELNNPIGFIYGNMKELQRYIDKMKNSDAMTDKKELDFIKQDIDSLIFETLNGSTRVKQIVEDLRNFSRLDEAEYKKVDIHEGLDATLSILKKEFGDRITLHKDYSDLPKIDCMPGQINQVFMNLLQNAIHAISSIGNIWVNTFKEKNEVCIRISDDGIGIGKDVIGKIFDPFFTTKDVGKGTGLGLSISYKIIENHNGKLQVTSKRGDRTTFTVRLPLKGIK